MTPHLSDRIPQRAGKYPEPEPKSPLRGDSRAMPPPAGRTWRTALHPGVPVTPAPPCAADRPRQPRMEMRRPA